MKKIIWVSIVFCSISFAVDSHMIRACRVFEKVAKNAKTVCSLKSGDEVEVIQRDEKIALIRSGSCRGYVYNSCVAEEISEVSYKAMPKIERSLFKVGFTLEGEGTAAKVGYSSDYSKGYGFGIGGIGEVSILPYLSIQLLPAYRYQRISRQLDASGSVKDPGATYKETTWNLSLSLRAAADIFMLFKSERRQRWTVSLGAEGLLPTGTIQTNPQGEDTDVPLQKMVNLVVGSGFEFPFSDLPFHLKVGADLFYHLTAQDSTGLYGLRAGVAFMKSL